LINPAALTLELLVVEDWVFGVEFVVVVRAGSVPVLPVEAVAGDDIACDFQPVSSPLQK
jgi:hypothetical protein